MQQAQETATETKTQCYRRFGCEGQCGIIELQLLKRGSQILKILGVNRINTGKDHRFHFLEAFDGFVAGLLNVSDGIAHTDLGRVLDARDDVPHVTCRETAARLLAQFEHTQLIDVILLLGVDKLHEIPLGDRAIQNLEINDDAPERVEHRVKDQGLQRRIGVALRSRDAVNDCIKDGGNAFTSARTATNDVTGIAPQQLNNFVFHLIGVGTVHVNLIDYRNDFQAIVNRHVQVGDSLGLHTLRCIHNKQCTLASGNRTRNFIREVHVSRSVDQVKRVFLTILHIVHLDGMTLDGDATLSLQVHVVEHLSLHVFTGYGIGVLEQTIGERALAVVDMRHDTEVAYCLHSLMSPVVFLFEVQS